MNAARTIAVALLGCVAACADADGISREVASASSRLELETIPVPCAGKGNYVWDADTWQLLVADAIAQCGANECLSGQSCTDDIHFPEWVDGTFPAAYDLAIESILYKMRDAAESLNYTATTEEEAIASWFSLRANSSRNCDPLTGATGRRVELERTPPQLVMPDYATREAYFASFNLCVANHLRRFSPGASGRTALTMDDTEQRELLQAISERAKVAMYHYGQLALAFATPNVSGNESVPSEYRFPALRALGNGLGTEALSKLGREFGAAVQLHVEVGEELLELLARSGSARIKASTYTGGDAFETWGYGSWHQRFLAAAYGGDPAMGSNEDKWWELKEYWPRYRKEPFIRTPMNEPQVLELLSLAREYDALVLEPNLEHTEYFCALDDRYDDADKNEADEIGTPFDIEATAAGIYEIVRAGLESDSRILTTPDQNSSRSCCRGPHIPGCEHDAVEACVCAVEPACCTAGWNSGCVDLVEEAGCGECKARDFDILWEHHRITMEHARTLASYLAEVFYREPCHPLATDLNSEIVETHRVGAMNWSGSITTETVGAAVVPRIYIDPSTTFSPRSLAQIAPSYTDLAQVRVPHLYELTYATLPASVSFDDDSGVSDVRVRIPKLGIVSSLQAVRHMVFQAMTQGVGGPRDAYLEDIGAVVDVIDASIGDTGVSLSPVVAQFPAPATPVMASDSALAVYVDVTFPEGDPWWSDAPGVEHYAYFPKSPTGFNLTDGELEQLVVNAGTSIDGLDINDLIVWTSALPSTWGTWRGTAHKDFIAGVPPNPGDHRFGPLFVGRFENGVGTIRVLAGNYHANAVSIDQGRYLAGGGALGELISRQIEPSKTNPAEKAYDGFGMPRHWVPPQSPELFNQPAGASASNHYLALAKESAQAAGIAVADAMEGLVEQYTSETQVASAAALAQQGLQEETETLCGAAGDCEPNILSVTLPADLFPAPPSCNDTSVECQLDQFVATQIAGLTSTQVDIAEPVYSQLYSPGVPTFEAYAGGSLQSAFIEQWRAIRAPLESVQALQSTVGAAKTHIDTAEVALNTATELAQMNCSPQAMAEAVLAGRSISVGGSVGFPSGGQVSVSMSYSPGPLIAQIQKCREMKVGLANEEQGVVEAMANAFASVSSAAQGLADNQAAIAQSSATIRALMNQTSLARSRHELEAQLAEEGAITSFGVFRSYRSYDLWRARTLVEGARRYAVAARRAIEAQYVVDLSRMTADEAFVASPALWADEVYGYDLSLPAAVGLETGVPVQGGIYPNKILDYVGNLEAFVNGFAVHRPSAVAHEEIDVVTLPGLVPGEPYVTGGMPLQEGSWSLRCIDEDEEATWVPVAEGEPSDACGSYASPDRAKLRFHLDPWARLNDSVANEPYARRYNGRWDALAVNFVGTGVRDCELAQDPLGCYANAYIFYDLTHVGPAWVTDYEGVWRALSFPTGRIEGGKAIAAELWLDPLKDGWDTPYISATQRSEFAVRPLGGAYELEFAVTPDIVLERLERVQLLIGSTYWVRQD